jgi:hypothetical protein
MLQRARRIQIARKIVNHGMSVGRTVDVAKCGKIVGKKMAK